MLFLLVAAFYLSCLVVFGAEKIFCSEISKSKPTKPNNTSASLAHCHWKKSAEKVLGGSLNQPNPNEKNIMGLGHYSAALIQLKTDIKKLKHRAYLIFKATSAVYLIVFAVSFWFITDAKLHNLFGYAFFLFCALPIVFANDDGFIANFFQHWIVHFLQLFLVLHTSITAIHMLSETPQMLITIDIVITMVTACFSIFGVYINNRAKKLQVRLISYPFPSNQTEAK